MARYIDAYALLENLKKQYGEELGWQCTVNMSDVGMMIEDAPAANVVPRSVITGIFAELDERLDNLMVVMNPHDGFITTFRKTMEKVTAEVDELKKKYTEADNDS